MPPNNATIWQYPYVDGSTLQLMTAAVGVAGTLSASVLAQTLGRRTERDRRQAEDRSRWLTERLRVSSKLGSCALALERRLYEACSLLDDEERADRLPGHVNIHTVPEEGLEDVSLDAFTLHCLVEAAQGGLDAFPELDQLVAELALLGEPEEAQAADELLDSLLVAIAMIEKYAPSKEGFQAVLECQTRRKRLVQASRRSLRIDQGVVEHRSLGRLRRGWSRAEIEP